MPGGSLNVSPGIMSFLESLGIPDAAILFDPSTISRLLGGLGVTLEIAIISVVLSIPLGIIVGMLMTLKNPVLRAILRVYLDFIRIMPQLVLLFIVFFGFGSVDFTLFGHEISWKLNGFVSSVIVFVLWGGAEMGDLTRGALTSIPRSQYDSSYVLGLTRRQTFTNVILPQAIRRLTPTAVNLTTRMIKTTSLCLFVGVVELLKTGQQVADLYRAVAPTGALWVYGAIFFMYFIICFPLSLVSRRLERRAVK